MKKFTPVSTWCKALCFALMLIPFVGASAQSTLTAGDIVFTGYNSDDPDQFSFLVLDTIEPGTVISFTDDGWYAAGGFRTNEGVIAWTATSGVSCATEITITSTGTNTFSATTGSVATTTNGFSLSTSGDQIIAFQGTTGSPTPIAAINMDGTTGWAADATSANNSALPTGLTNGVTALSFSAEYDDGKYNCSFVQGGKTYLDTAVNNQLRWTLSDNLVSLPAGCTFTCTPPVDCAGVPGGTAFYDNCGVCAGGTTGVTPNVDTDHDGTLDCNDGCPNDPNKIAPGICGCGLPDTSLANAGPDIAVCAGDQATLTATGGGTYNWNTGDNTSSTQVTPSGSSVSYNVTVTNNDGCVSYDTVVVTVNPLPTADAGTDQTICPGTSTTFTATGGVSYAWSSGANTDTTTVSAANDYVVTVTNSFNCSATDTVTLALYPQPVIDAGADQTVCPGSSATFNATGGATYIWSTGNTTSFISVSAVGDYDVTGTDVNGCVATDTVSLLNYTAPAANAGNDTTVCIGNSVTFTATGGNSYAWSSGDNTAATTVSTADNYVVTVTDGNSCTATDTVALANFTPPVVNAGSDTVVCPGASATFTATGAVTYNWSNAVSSATNTVDVAGIYVAEGTDANGCTATDTVTLSNYTAPVVNAGADTTVCPGNSADFTATGAVSYVWSNTSTTATITANVATTYSVTGTDANGCTATDTVSLANFSAPVISAGSDTAVCEGNSATFTATGGNSYVWNTGATTAAITADTTGTYSVAGTDANGCVGTDTVALTVNAQPVVSITGLSNTICSDTTAITLVGSPTGGTFTGMGVSGGTFDPSITGTGTFAIAYNYTDGNGCSSTASDTVTVTICTGIDNINNNLQINVYPNPFHNQVVVKLNDVQQTLQVRLMDVTGRTVVSQEIAPASGKHTVTLTPNTHLANGIYLLEVKGNNYLQTFRIMHAE